MKKKFLIWAGAVCLLAAVVCSFILDIPTMGMKTISFPSTYKGENVVLKASYLEVEGAEYGVLICPGYSCDRQKWRPMANLFARNGYSVMTFDYSGQGASSGTIGFDNAKTDAIPVQIDDAIERLHELSGLDYSHIIPVGHSMGGRSILRLLYDYHEKDADTTVKKRDIPAVILLSPEVNYNYNAQASLFAGTSDSTSYPWINYSEQSIADTQVYLFGSTNDDIVSDEDVLQIYKHLGADESMVPQSGKWWNSTHNANGTEIAVGITSGVLHSYVMYSPKFADYVNRALTNITGEKTVYNPHLFRLVYASWLLGLAGLLMLLWGLNYQLKWEHSDDVPMLCDSKKYLVTKLVLWLPAAIVAFVICCLTVVMPFGSPVMNTPYMCFIAGYGLTMLWAYRKGRFKGTEGKLPKMSLEFHADKKKTFLAVGTAMAICWAVWFILRATMYRLIPFNMRLFWVLFATILMTVGYYVSGAEQDMFENAKVGIKVRLYYNMIQYVPLFLLVIFYMALKSYSGMIGQVQNMLLMYIFCIPLGNYLKKKTGNRVLGAVVSAFLFQTLMITSAALIAMF